ncbi:MAG: hypothetical protein AAFR96_10935 [Planctomycetota bacterium]
MNDLLPSTMSRPLAPAELNKVLGLARRQATYSPDARNEQYAPHASRIFQPFVRPVFAPGPGTWRKPAWIHALLNPFAASTLLAVVPVVALQFASALAHHHKQAIKSFVWSYLAAATIWLPAPLLMALFFNFYHQLFHLHATRALKTLAPISLTPSAFDPTSLRFVGIAIGATYWLVLLNVVWKRAAHSRDPGHCANCNYERGPLDTCPECGTPRSAPATKLSKAKRRILIAGYATIPLLLIAPFWISWIDIAIYHARN